MALRVVFMGTPEFAVPTLAAIAGSGHRVTLAVTRPDRARGRGRQVADPPVELAARERGIAVFQPEDLRAPESIERLRQESADVFAVAAFGQLLSKAVLAVPRLGPFNLHASLLPKYRGAAPMTYAVWKGETETGLTIFRMVREMDAGDVALQVRTPIGPEETAGELHDRMAQLGAGLFVEFLDRLEAGTIRFSPQDAALATFAPSLKKEDGQIDWTQPARQIVLHVRAMCPWPGAYTWLRTAGGDRRLTLLKAAARAGPAEARPGEVIEAAKDRFVVAAGEGQLLVQRLQPAGKRAMDAVEFLRGHRLNPGDRLGAPESQL
jgi:methionyl-tRNA formyltransferase